MNTAPKGQQRHVSHNSRPQASADDDRTMQAPTARPIPAWGKAPCTIGLLQRAAFAILALALLCSTRATAQTPDPWYNHAVIYEIYPRSFQDTNNDGVGDLNGITQRLDYLQHLGVDAIWIAPMYPSPQVDFGYDIANYTAVDPQYGTLADFDRLLAAANAHHIRILLDMVLNHTSDKHPWFQESASSRTNPKADWYIWNDGKPDPLHGKGLNAHQGPNGWVVPPNNWSSLFQGSSWEWVPARGQFYYHFFYKQQPDLNWRNPAVEKAMFDAMRFWLDRGVAGFRLDAITTLFEDPTLHDEPLTGKLDASGFPESNHTLTSGLPEVHDVLRRLRKMMDSYPNNRVLVGEIYVPATGELRQWYGTPSSPELQLPMDTLVGFHEEGNGITGAKNVALNLAHIRRTITEMETQLDGHQPLLVFDNHDNPRSWDRFGDGVHNAEIARIIATLLYTTRAAALTYYGAEIGMHTQIPTRVEDVRDPIGITGWPKEKGRDGERTPMQWSPDPQAGFSTNPHTWLPVEPDFATVNAATETADPSSLLNWNRTLIAIRRDNPTMHDGTLVMLDTANPSVLSYVRTGPHPLVVSLNMTSQPQVVHLDLSASGIKSRPVKTLLGDAASLTNLTTVSEFTLPPYASLIAEVQ
jgi:alpha-glucosidase